jgi:Fe-S cluster assembly protein SufD
MTGRGRRSGHVECTGRIRLGKGPILHTFSAEGSAALAGPAWLRDRRAAGYEAFASTPLPSEDEEVWRYTPIGRLSLDRYQPVRANGASHDVSDLAASVASAVGPTAALVLVHNGWPVSTTLGPGARLAVGGTAEVAGARDIVGSVQRDGDALVRMNDAFTPDAVVVDVPPQVVVEDPVLVVHWCDAESSAVLPRTCVRAQEEASVAVVEVFAGPASSSLVVPVTELSAASHASLSYVALQVLDEDAWSIARLAARGGAGATVRTFTMGLGAAYDRIRADVAVEGRGARSEILSAYLGRGEQVHDVRTLQDHLAERTNSELLCQGAVADRSRSVYSGLIRVHRGAVRSDARQTNHNLVLDEGAHADSVPNLDILENDVSCSHASTVGPVDEDQRYYIESRGVPPELAEGLIVRGFFDDIIDRGPVPAATPLLRREVRDRLSSLLAGVTVDETADRPDRAVGHG